MQNRILFNGKTLDIKEFNNNTLTIADVIDETYYLTFDSYVPLNMKIKIINSKVTIIENYLGDIKDANFSLEIDENSSLSRFSILVNNNSDIKVTRNIDNKGFYESMQLDLTTASVDSVENINLVKEEATSSVIDGIYATLTSNKKYQTNLNHFTSNGSSKAQIFAINNDKAHVSIYTDAFIKNKAKGTKTTQEGRIINLSDTCSGIVLPNLHIDENDVEASHSCSVGSLNQEHLYYLLSRGLSPDKAKNILIKGYFNPILKGIKDENIFKELNEVLDQRIG